MAAQSTIPRVPGVFSRQASGLVRVGGAWDTLIFNVGIISIGFGIAFNEYLGPSAYRGASEALSTLLAAAGTAFVCAAYYCWAVILPRSGGNYVFLSRTFSPGLAFVLSLLEVVYMAWAAALGATLFVTTGVAPLLATAGAVADSPTLLHAAAKTSTPIGTFLIGTAVIILAAVVMTTGIRRHFAIQKVLFAIAMAGIVVLGLVLAFGSPARFARHLSAIGGLDYSKVIDTAQAHGYTHSGFAVGATLAFVVIGWYAAGVAPSSIAIGGEIRRIQRSQLWGMFGALALVIVVIAAFDPLSRHAFGDRFLGAITYNSLNGVAGGSTEGTIGATPYVPVLAGILSNNVVLAVVISATFALWTWFWIPNLMAYGTRSMIAWSFDRVAPDKLGYVSERFRTPVVAIWTYAGAMVALTWLIAYRHLNFLTFTEVYVAVWVVAMVAAVVFPYRRREMYQASPVARLRVLGLPLMTVSGFLGAVFMSIMFYLLWTDRVAAGPMIKHPLPVEFWITIGTTAFGALWYAGVKAYRQRSGVDIRLAFQQIPIE